MDINTATKEMEKVLYEIGLPRRKYRILFVTDLHMKDVEFKHTIRYVPDQESVLMRIIKGAEEGKYDVVVLLGDVFDNAYKDVSKALFHISLFERLKQAVNGYLFKVIGNHYLNKNKAHVPTFHLLGTVKSARIDKEQLVTHVTNTDLVLNYGNTNPVFIAPDRLHVNGNIINFFHYNKHNKDYYDSLEGVKYNKHIACYHDSIMPSYVRKGITELSNGGRFTLPTAHIVENTGLFKNVDYAMIGDIHTKVGEFKVTDSETGFVTVADIPGSLGRTANHLAQLHNEVYLPLLDIHEDGTVVKEHIHFPLTDYRKVFRLDVQEEEREQETKLKDFKSAIGTLKQGASIVDAMEISNIEQRTKDIINKILVDEDPGLNYRQYAEEHGLLGVRKNV